MKIRFFITSSNGLSVKLNEILVEYKSLAKIESTIFLSSLLHISSRMVCFCFEALCSWIILWTISLSFKSSRSHFTNSTPLSFLGNSRLRGNLTITYFLFFPFFSVVLFMKSLISWIMEKVVLGHLTQFDVQSWISVKCAFNRVMLALNVSAQRRNCT